MIWNSDDPGKGVAIPVVANVAIVLKAVIVASAISAMVVIEVLLSLFNVSSGWIIMSGSDLIRLGLFGPKTCFS